MISGSQRREQILEILRESDTPMSATTLASRFDVSRQIIVGDIALIRAQGVEVYATPRGYVIPSEQSETIVKKIACVHNGPDTAKELNTIVDFGCKVIDVIVEHPVYGQIIGQLQIASRFDVEQFIQRVNREKAHSLSELTDGIHIHTIECPSTEALDNVITALRDMGMLLEED